GQVILSRPCRAEFTNRLAADVAAQGFARLLQVGALNGPIDLGTQLLGNHRTERFSNWSNLADGETTSAFRTFTTTGWCRLWRRFLRKCGCPDHGRASRCGDKMST